MDHQIINEESKKDLPQAVELTANPFLFKTLGFRIPEYPYIQVQRHIC